MTRLAVYAALIALCALAYWTIVPRARRPAFLAVASAVFVASFGITGAVYIVLNVLLIWACARAIGRDPGRKGLFLRLGLVWLIASLCLFKFGPAVLRDLSDQLGAPGLGDAGALLPLGFSYVIFRMIHFVVEVHRGRIKDAGFAEFAAYVLFFPTFLAGPVERFPRFAQQARAQDRLAPEDLRIGLLRVLRGAFRKIVIADTLAPHVRSVLENPAAHSPGTIVLAVYGVAIWLYMDFGGYTDIALGVARCFGYQIVENFRHPFFRTSIAEFWRNWHISLYSFIRDYFFLPFFGSKPSRLKTDVGVVATMVAFMIWHGASASWLALGVYHGGALVAWSHFQDLKARSPKLRRALATTTSKLLCGLLTFHFVAFGLLFFFWEFDHVWEIVRRLGPAA